MHKFYTFSENFLRFFQHKVTTKQDTDTNYMSLESAIIGPFDV
jgi:hypothetical protein